MDTNVLAIKDFMKILIVCFRTLLQSCVLQNAATLASYNR
jgi:hypothetical protein